MIDTLSGAALCRPRNRVRPFEELSTLSKVLACAGLLAALLAISAAPARALKFHSDLSSIKIEALPGQSINRSFKMTLEKDELRAQFKVHVEDWWRSEDGKQSFYRPPGTLKHSCAPWVKLNPMEATVNPGGTLDVRISASVPNDVKPGGYWCALTVDEVLDPLKIVPEGVGVRFLASVSVGIFINVTPVERTAHVLQVDVLSEQALVKLSNDGNCPLGVEGRIEFIRPGDTKPMATVLLARATVLTEPIHTALFPVALPDAVSLPSGHYRIRVILDIGLTHYIGVQKEMEIVRATPASTPIATQAK
jgi:hypothetical protein